MINEHTIQEAVATSIMILGGYVAFMQGMIFGWLRIAAANMFDWLLGKRWSVIIQKPLWGCYSCMGGLWTIVLTWSFNIEAILLVVGLNYLIQTAIIDGDANSGI